MIFITKIPMRKREFDARVFFLTNMIFLKRSLKIRNQSLCSKMAFRAKISEDAQKQEREN
jgi:hypothetical protein